jgi:hypothetical protein
LSLRSKPISLLQAACLPERTLSCAWSNLIKSNVHSPQQTFGKCMSCGAMWIPQRMHYFEYWAACRDCGRVCSSSHSRKLSSCFVFPSSESPSEIWSLRKGVAWAQRGLPFFKLGIVHFEFDFLSAHSFVIYSLTRVASCPISFPGHGVSSHSQICSMRARHSRWRSKVTSGCRKR